MTAHMTWGTNKKTLPAIFGSRLAPNPSDTTTQNDDDESITVQPPIFAFRVASTSESDPTNHRDHG